MMIILWLCAYIIYYYTIYFVGLDVQTKNRLSKVDIIVILSYTTYNGYNLYEHCRDDIMLQDVPT
jgi:hypothetical protein